jgi:hypothetical protein
VRSQLFRPVSQIDSEIDVNNNVDAETTSVGSVNQGISLPGNDGKSHLELESAARPVLGPDLTRPVRDRRTAKHSFDALAVQATLAVIVLSRASLAKRTSCRHDNRASQNVRESRTRQAAASVKRSFFVEFQKRLSK